MKFYKFQLAFVLLFVISCGKADINGECTITGNGNASCTFQNLGSAKGSICYTLSLERNEDQDWYDKGKLYPAGMYGTIGDKVISSSQICSGIVEPDDIVEREKFTSFTGLTMASLTKNHSPSDWCSKHPGYGSKDYSTSWVTGCNFNYGENETAHASEEALAALAEVMSGSDEDDNGPEPSDSNL